MGCGGAHWYRMVPVTAAWRQLRAGARGEGAPAPQRCSALRSAGQQLAGPRGVNDVMWLQDDLTGVEVDLHHAGERKGDLAHGAEDDRTVGFDPDQIDPDVPEPYLTERSPCTQSA